jgi:hypothetical protein
MPDELPDPARHAAHRLTPGVTYRPPQGLGAAPDAPDAPSPALARRLLQLRASVECYVRGRRAAGVPVERVIPEVERLVREAARRERWPGAVDALLAPVARWTAEAHADAPADAPARAHPTGHHGSGAPRVARAD